VLEAIDRDKTNAAAGSLAIAKRAPRRPARLFEARRFYNDHLAGRRLLNSDDRLLTHAGAIRQPRRPGPRLNDRGRTWRSSWSIDL